MHILNYIYRSDPWFPILHQFPALHFHLHTYLKIIFHGCWLMYAASAAAQPNAADSLRKLLNSPEVKKMSFADLLSVQQNFSGRDKPLTLAFAEELLSRRDLMANDSLKAISLMVIGENYRNYGDNAKAGRYLTESIALFSQKNMLAQKAEAMVYLGNYYTNTDQDTAAIDLYTRSIEIAEKNNDTAGMMRPYRSITGLFLKMGLYDKTLSYGFAGLKMAKKFRNDKVIAALYNNIAAAHHKKERYDSSIFYFREALFINSGFSDTETIIRNLSNLATSFIYSDQIDSAAKYMGEAEKLLATIDVPRTFIYTYSAIAALKNKQSRFREAVNYAKEVILVAGKSGLEGLSDGAWEQLVISYKGLKLPDSALAALENYWSIKQKFLETGRNKTVAMVEQQFQQYKKDNEITLLKKDRVLGKTQRNAAFAVAGLLAIAAFLFYNRFRLKKKTSDALAQKNEEIEKQKNLIETSLAEKETLLREIHHRVKNNLQIISSLLNIQSQHIQDENVLSSIQEGQSRVQAMSLIHQNLYQSEHLSNVDIQNYLQQLVTYLSEMFTGQNKDVQVKVDAAHINFDIDTAIPLGLIINELVSNAYKYAFEKTGSGTIHISIKPKNEVDYELEIRDDGKGLPPALDTEKGTSLGLKLVKILSRQLRGKFSARSDNGAVFLIQFKDLRAYSKTTI